MKITYHALIAGSQKVAYRRHGHPAPTGTLVLLHGFCEEATMWGEWIYLLRDRAIIMIDLPGFGQSDLPYDAGIDAYARAVKMVLDEENINKCFLVGHSMGGYTALEFAHHYPEMLQGIGLFHSHPFADTPAQKDNRNRGIEMIRGGKKDLYVAQLFPKLFEDEFEQKFPGIVEQMIRTGQEQSAEGIINALKSMRDRPDRTTVLKDALYPVLFMLGKKDELIPYAEAMSAAVLPSWADVHLLETAGHMGMFETKAETAAIVLRFLESK